MPNHTVAQGECLITIAKSYGFTDYHTIYNHPGNASLKRKRPNPNILYTGDVVFVPDKAVKESTKPVGQTHVYQIKSTNVHYRTIIRDGRGNPLANMAYTLDLDDGKELTGSTDNTGLIDVLIPIGAESAKLSLPNAQMTWQINFGHLDPIESTTGVQARLKGLGYAVGPIDGEEDSRLSALLSSFQKDQGLTVTGTMDGATRAKLESLHGC